MFSIRNVDEPSNDERFRGQCPLTQLGVFGLTSFHRVRLCSKERAQTSIGLAAHFHRFHHLTWSLSLNLTKLIKENVDPYRIQLFKKDVDPIDPRFRLKTCPMNKIFQDETNSFCRRKFHRNSMKQHLIHYHHLSLDTANKIMKENFIEIDISSL